MSNSTSILVIGATGKQGGAVIEALLASGTAFNIIAVTRTTSSGSSWALASKPHVTVIEGDLSNPDAIFDKASASASGPVWGVFSVQSNSDDEETQGKKLIDVAGLHGVSHFVQASGDRGGPVKSERDATNVKNFAAKFEIEKHLQKRTAVSPQKMTYTILRPVTFFENLTTDIQGKGFARMWEQMGAEKKLQMVSTRDIGWFAADALTHPHSEANHNTGVTLLGDELTQPEANAIFEAVVGRPMAMVPCPVGSALKFMMKGTVGDMFRWFKEVGYGGDVKMCRERNLAMQDFGTWLKRSSPFVQR
ncbi:hypothetical protein LTR08_005433 [Meristemomyces frigidus]|nr:hypothetical protein LTR08_005433 [Meristemomyces frigidus]